MDAPVQIQAALPYLLKWQKDNTVLSYNWHINFVSDRFTLRKCDKLEKFFRYLGHKAGPSIRKGKWIYHSFFADKEQAIESEYLVGKELSLNVLSEYQKLDDA